MTELHGQMRIVSLTSARNEGPFLVEWIAWHRIIGVTDFLIYTNDCTDHSDEMLDLLDKAGIVSHMPNPARPNRSIQWEALNAGWQHPLRKAADWMLISDMDEFPMIHAGAHRLPDLLAPIPEETDAIAMPWRLFGTADHDTLEGCLVTQALNRCAPAEMFHPGDATYFKSLFRPKAFRGPGVHRPKPKEDRPILWMGGDGQPLPARFASMPKRVLLIGHHLARSAVEMHHYSLRSAQDFVVKADRGLPNRQDKRIDLSYWVERNFNTEENNAARALAAPLRAEIDALMAVPGLAELHAASCDWHRQRFRDLVRKHESFRLYCDIQHARQSAVLSPQISAHLLRMFSMLQRDK